MAFTVEDGDGLSTANAYITEQEYRDHHTDRGIDVTLQVQADVETAIVRATDYVDKRFGRRFRGDRLNSTQGLEWPRSDAYTDEDYLINDVPIPMKKAISEYTLLSIQLARNLAPLPAPDFGILDPETGLITNDSSGKIIEKAEEVGPIKERTKYADNSQYTQHQIPPYPQADLWLEEILKSSSGGMVVRG